MSTLPEPNNQHTSENPVGRFMVAVGAVIIHPETKQILLGQRASTLDWHPDEWEISYGRIDQHEDPEDGLRREVREELGITDLQIERVLRVWHLYRGVKSVENDLIGITYVCTSRGENIKLSSEHQAHEWMSVEDALQRISIEGIRKDVEAYQKSLQL